MFFSFVERFIGWNSVDRSRHLIASGQLHATSESINSILTREYSAPKLSVPSADSLGDPNSCGTFPRC